MENREQIEFYKNALKGIIDSIERLDVLIYLERLVSRIIKEAR